MTTDGERRSGYEGVHFPVPISTRLPDRLPLEGSTDAPGAPGKYGSAVIEGVRFGVTKIELRMGRMIFTCTLMIPAPFPFVIKPGSPVKIYGEDDQLFLDHVVPGLGTMPDCPVRPGDQCTIFLPYSISDVRSGAGDHHQVNDVIAEGSWPSRRY